MGVESNQKRAGVSAFAVVWSTVLTGTQRPCPGPVGKQAVIRSPCAPGIVIGAGDTGTACLLF